MEINKVKIEKLKMVVAPDRSIDNVVAFQLVRITSLVPWLDYSETHDTRIYSCGRQEIINGDGFFKPGTVIP